MKYRKKPGVVIEATQWFKNGDHPLDYVSDYFGSEGWVVRRLTAEYRKEQGWEGEVVRYYQTSDLNERTPCKHCGTAMNRHGWIDTLEGGHIVCPGDWIITGVVGEVYPVKNSIFLATYEVAE